MSDSAEIVCWTCGAAWFSAEAWSLIAREGRACLACRASLTEARPALVPTYVWEHTQDGEVDFILRRVNDAALDATDGRAAKLVGRVASELYADEPRAFDVLREASEAREPVFRRLPGYRMRSTDELLDAEVEVRRGLPGLVLVTVISTRARNPVNASGSALAQAVSPESGPGWRGTGPVPH